MKTALAIALLLMVMPASARSDNDPWAEVPPLPTSCYRGSHEFEDAASAATEVLQARQAEQTEINQDIDLQYSEMDIMEKQQHLMTLMAENPERAQQYIQNMQQGAMGVQDAVPDLSERQIQLDTELQQLKATYDTELQQAMGPLQQRQEALGATLAKSCNQELLDKAVALQTEKNRAYQGFCANWWKGGPLHDWLARFKDFKMEEAALWSEYAETQKLSFEMAGIAADRYRSTGEFQAAIEYLRRATEVFRWREFAPVSEEMGTCEIRHG